MSPSKAAKSFLKNAGQAENLKGFSAERKALETLFAHRGDEKWIRLVRKGTREEDIGQGIDIVVETTDMGKLFIQIKSSKKGKEKFCEIRRRPMIAVVVIERQDDLELIWQRLRQALLELRAKILAKRNG